MTKSPSTTHPHRTLLEGVAERARAAGVFAAVQVHPHQVVCEAKDSAAPAQYRVNIEDGKVYVELTTADRWLSHSIEADLLNTGDKLEELIDEELVELGGSAIQAKVEHFRNDSKLFVFRSLLPITPSSLPEAAATEMSMRALMAYEACFSSLGDMGAGGKEA